MIAIASLIEMLVYFIKKRPEPQPVRIALPAPLAKSGYDIYEFRPTDLGERYQRIVKVLDKEKFIVGVYRISLN